MVRMVRERVRVLMCCKCWIQSGVLLLRLGARLDSDRAETDNRWIGVLE